MASLKSGGNGVASYGFNVLFYHFVVSVSVPLISITIVCERPYNMQTYRIRCDILLLDIGEEV